MSEVRPLVEILFFAGCPNHAGAIELVERVSRSLGYALSCRVFRTEAGVSGQPHERWVRQALLREVNGDQP